jgi:hypothetical protein
MFYQSTTVKEKILREVSEFLERYLRKKYDLFETRWDSDNKTRVYERPVIMDNKQAYNGIEKGCVYITESGYSCFVKLEKNYEIYIHFDWAYEGDLNLHLILKSYRIGVIQDSSKERIYTSYFYSDKEKKLSERIEDELINDLQQALGMEKDDWKRMEKK